MVQNVYSTLSPRTGAVRPSASRQEFGWAIGPPIAAIGLNLCEICRNQLQLVCFQEITAPTDPASQTAKVDSPPFVCNTHAGDLKLKTPQMLDFTWAPKLSNQWNSRATEGKRQDLSLFLLDVHRCSHTRPNSTKSAFIHHKPVCQNLVSRSEA